MTLREILARRETIRTELRGIIDQHPDGTLTDEVRARADELETEANRLTDQERRQALIDDMDRRAGGTPFAGAGGDRFEVLAAQVTALDVIRAQMGGTDAASGRAREVSAELERRSGRRAEGLLFSTSLSGAPVERRVFTTANPAGGPGSNLISTDVSPNLISRLRERPVIRSLGATILAGLSGNVSLPRLKASATGYWVAENSPITVSDPQTDAVGLTPKHVGGIVEISRNMIQQPSLDVARMVEDDLMQIIASAMDRAAIVGGGSNEPRGLLASGSGIGSIAMGTNGAALDWNSIVALISAVDVANALTGSLGFLGNAQIVGKARRTPKTSTDTASNFLMDAPGTLAGYPFASTSNVPATGAKGSGTNLSTLIFGNWQDLVIGFWSELDVCVNMYESTAYAKGNVQIRAMATADVAIRHPLSFAAIVDAVTT
jgi:HK97 family phage major capsid protein